MKVERDERFDTQRRAFSLRFCCEHCAFFHEPSGRCVHDFPNVEHRLERYEGPYTLIVFCKDFELV
jgi:hypothetical protein